MGPADGRTSALRLPETVRNGAVSYCRIASVLLGGRQVPHRPGFPQIHLGRSRGPPRCLVAAGSQALRSSHRSLPPSNQRPGVAVIPSLLAVASEPARFSGGRRGICFCLSEISNLKFHCRLVRIKCSAGLQPSSLSPPVLEIHIFNFKSLLRFACST